MDAQLVEERIVAVAARQRGAIGRGQLVEAGLARGAIEHRARSGRLHRHHRGVYSLGHPHLDREGRWWAAVLAGGPGAVLSHASAAAARDLRQSASAFIDVSVPTRGGRARQDGIRLHRLASLHPEDVTHSMPGLPPITTPARTLLDLATTLPRAAVERAFERAEALRLLDVDELHALLARRLPGTAALRACLEAAVDCGPTLTASDLEDAFLTLCLDRGLPRPHVNHPVGPYVADFLWPTQRLIAETDGRATHGTAAAFERDRARDADLLLAGYRTVRFSYLQVTRRPEQVAATLAGLLS